MVLNGAFRSRTSRLVQINATKEALEKRQEVLNPEKRIAYEKADQLCWQGRFYCFTFLDRVYESYRARGEVGGMNDLKPRRFGDLSARRVILLDYFVKVMELPDLDTVVDLFDKRGLPY